MTAATSPSRDAAIQEAVGYLLNGTFEERLRKWVAIPSASRVAANKPDLWRYLTDEMQPLFERLGFKTRIFENELAPGPFLLAERIEDPNFTTVLQYGHGDVVAGLDEQWDKGLSPFAMTEKDGRWYGRGTADNKGQHAVNIMAIEALLAVRGSLGFNLKFLIEMGGGVRLCRP